MISTVELWNIILPIFGTSLRCYTIFPWVPSMPVFWITFFPFQPCLQVHWIIKSCSLKFHDVVTYAFKRFVLGLLCGSFQFVPQSSVVLRSFFVVDILPLPSFILFSYRFLCNPWLSCSPLDFSNQQTGPKVSILHWILTYDAVQSAFFVISN